MRVSNSACDRYAERILHAWYYDHETVLLMKPDLKQ